jgi:hypothetical protein
MKILTAFVFLFLLAGCHSNEGPAKTKITVADTAKFYPLESFFRKQVEYVDLRNFPLYKITVKDGKKDSSAITKDQFIAFAQVFIDRSISAPAVKALYKESVFHDLSTKSYTLNYTPNDRTAAVQNIDILLDDETNIVKRVFIKSSYTRGDTAVDEQCNWKADKSFQLNRFLQTKNGFKSTELNYVNWNERKD